MDALLNTPNTEVYICGGYVRDRLLNLDPKDHDYVVVGSTPQAMIDLGFTQVAESFPVFLHPISGDEWALARTERKVGFGYSGFKTDYDPSISIEQDLERRDLTINSMCRRVIGFNDKGHATLSDDIIDPFGGQTDLSAGRIRATSNAFSEDPLRVLRAARFAARFNFTITPATQDLMAQLVLGNEMKVLTPERVWIEIKKAMTENFPHRFWEELRGCGAMDRLFPVLSSVSSTRFHQLQNVAPHLRMPLVTMNCDVDEVTDMLTNIKAPYDVIKACRSTCITEQWMSTYKYKDDDCAYSIMVLFAQLDVFRNSSVLLNVVIPLQMIDRRFCSLLLEDCFSAASVITFASLDESDQQTLTGKAIGDKITDLRTEAIDQLLVSNKK